MVNVSRTAAGNTTQPERIYNARARSFRRSLGATVVARGTSTVTTAGLASPLFALAELAA